MTHAEMFYAELKHILNTEPEAKRAKARSLFKPTEILITFNGETKNMTAWGLHYNLPVSTISGRLARKWSIKRALTTPARYVHRDP